jgi:hypothetical protein
MKWMIGGIAFLALALVGDAFAVTPAWMAQDTKKVVNKRLAFVDPGSHVTSVRCQKETATAFFCLVNISGGYGRVAYNVTVNPNTGNINWSLSK